ncbi:MAG: uroporphyrinogen-III synthase [Betaproteobacteria bacterium]
MSSAGPLAGKVIAVTRPRRQAESLAHLIEAAGGTPLLAPLLEIAPPDDAAPLRQAAERLNDFALAVFISPNAVDYSLPAILAHGPWPAGVRPAAVGQGTVRALAARGIEHCIAPTERFDSEALLELPALSAAEVCGRRVVIFRGDGGRELLAETLRSRGAEVEAVTCYRRFAPPGGFDALIAACREGRLDALTISSSEGLHYLMDGLDDAARRLLTPIAVFVPHARILETARSLGFRHTFLTAPADTGFVAGLCVYNWHSS